MKISINEKALSAFGKLGAVALITATMFFAACKPAGGGSGSGNGGGNKPTPKPKHAITFSVEGENGTLTAKVDGGDIASGKEVEEGKVITFTATANAGYRVKEWKVGEEVVANNKTNTYTHTVAKAVTVKVSFEAIPKHEVTFSVDGKGGTLTAKADGIDETQDSPINIEEGKEVTFTATTNANYKVKGWTLDGNAVNGTAETYTLPVTQAAQVSVSFEFIPPEAPFVEGGISLILDPDKLNIRVKAVTSDGSLIQVEGCDEKTLESGVEATVYAKGEKVTLKGNITELSCYNNQLLALGVQGLTALQKLDCSDNQLTSLNVQGLTALQKLLCNENQLKNLNVQGCTSLQKLPCYKNQLTSLNVQGLIALQELDCSDNQLNSLDASSLTSLQELQCGKNKLTSINVQGLTTLQKLSCYNNQFKSLDVSSLTSLKELHCANNQLTEIDVKGLTALQWFSCNDNQILELDVKDLPVLRRLDCYKNQLTNLNMQGLPALKQLFCNENQLTSLNVQILTALERLDCQKNKLASLNVQGLNALKYIDCHSNKFNAQAMKELLNALPARTEKDYAKATLYSEYHSEENHKDFTTDSEAKTAFEGAKNKKWTLKKVDAKGYLADI